MTEWENIKNRIRKAKTPLSDGAWKDMEQALKTATPNNRKRRYGILLLIPFLLSLGWIFTSQLTEEPTPPPLPQGSKQDVVHGLPEKLNAEEPITKEERATSNDDIQPDHLISTTEEHISTNKLSQGDGGPVTESRRMDNNPSTRTLPVNYKPLATLMEFPLDPPALVDKKGGSRLPALEMYPTDRSSEKRSHWEIKGTAGFNIASTGVRYQNDPNTTHKDFNEAVDGSVRPGFGYQAGIELSWFIRPNIRIGSGIGFRTITTRNEIDFSVRDIPVIDSSSGNIIGYIPTNNPVPQASRVVNTYRYISVPLGLFYQYPINEKWALTGELNNSVSFLTSQNEERIDPSQMEVKSSSEDLFNPVIFQYQLKLGLRYQLDRDWSLSFEPSYQGQYNNTYRSNEIMWKPWAVAFDLGVIYRW